MAQPIIELHNVSKRYRLQERRAGERLLTRQVIDGARRAFRAIRGGDDDHQGVIWALKDVSFTVQPGEAVGVIGGNGAGKSTLLKLIAQLTRPTHGTVRVRGRVGSMLEVGVGFNHELTGRENVYLSGVILGVPRAEIRRRFDEIVAFSGVERFIDTAVKRYSSGMRARLAFAVMSSLEPEVLLIDEVLGVGDAEFRKKSSERMEQLIKGGSTVMLVSHNEKVIQNLCDRAIRLDQGRLVEEGLAEAVIADYQSDTMQEEAPPPEPPQTVATAPAQPGPAPLAEEPPAPAKAVAAAAASPQASPRPASAPAGEPPPAATPPERAEAGQPASPAVAPPAKDGPRPQALVVAAAVLNAGGEAVSEVEISEPVRLEVEYELFEPLADLILFCRVLTADGTTVLGTSDADTEPGRTGVRQPGRYRASTALPPGLLEAGEYTVAVTVGIPFIKNLHRVRDACGFRVVDRSSVRRATYGERTRPGLFGGDLPWAYHGTTPWDDPAVHAARSAETQLKL